MDKHLSNKNEIIQALEENTGEYYLWGKKYKS